MSAATLRAPRVTDLDTRLAGAAVLTLGRVSRAALLAVIADHDAPANGRCPGCGWQTGRGQRTCPSRAMARAVADRRPVPAWLLHLVDAVPGALAPGPRPTKDDTRRAEDALPGLFDAPARQNGL